MADDNGTAADTPNVDPAADTETAELAMSATAASAANDSTIDVPTASDTVPPVSNADSTSPSAAAVTSTTSASNWADSILDETAEEAEIDIDFETDPRVQWIKTTILKFIGIEDEDLFYNMLDIDNTRRKLAALITSPIKSTELSLDKRTFFINKIIVDKLIHVDTEFTEWSKFLNFLDIG